MARASRFRFTLVLLVLAVLVSGYAGCDWRSGLRKVGTFFEKTIGPKTARERYAKELGADAGAKLVGWERAYANADTQRLKIQLPHREIFQLDTTVDYSAQALHFTLKAGRILRIEGTAEGGTVFGELYKTDPSGRRYGRPIATWKPDRLKLEYEPWGRSENLVFLLQSSLGTRVSAQVSLASEAALLFPVAGKDETAIKSFWGASRDGGRRSHKGNDIFADKGTPLLAVADGRIFKVANGGLGGKTVWLYDNEREQSYYYAHLDEQWVRRGQYVQRGDSLGTVGNTGNARTTPPHLHFGVYADGPYDPYSLLQRDDPLPPGPIYDLEPGQSSKRVPLSGNHYLRESPERKGTVLRQLNNGEPVTALAVTGKFYRVVTGRGEFGYVNFD
ncbi:M23 family metallopeptidase [Lewinella sp. 4G2]|uniref:peptidoglycan DD-metalloendopeptidase family protein n=1 Tax=Lewinella sp. 4G2 TaxID=1803372 RepID=UPI0007B4A7DA|nr:M23 family metallopeptidase [Lewinella sp. 4G2]OAV43180.1 hypothetical protein A3850_001120 [Lewinella sp. 4G2]